MCLVVEFPQFGIRLKDKGCSHLLYLCDLTHVTHTKRLRRGGYECQNNNVSLGVGLTFSKVYWVLSD